MVAVVVTDRTGTTRNIDTEPGMSLMESIRDAGIDDLLALCGGCCSCATCHVFIDPDYFEATGPVSSDEKELITTSDHKNAYSRLACQLKMQVSLAGMSVTIAPED